MLKRPPYISELDTFLKQLRERRKLVPPAIKAEQEKYQRLGQKRDGTFSVEIDTMPVREKE